MMVRAAFIGLLMVIVASAMALVDRGAAGVTATPDLENLLPSGFDDWKQIELTTAVLPAEVDLVPGEAVAYRAYRDSAGRLVTLVIAYGPPLGDSVRLHRPESCYIAQGFAILDRRVDRVNFREGGASIVRLRTENSLRHEAVSYWLRDGDAYVTTAPGHQLLTFKRGLSGSADNILVRVSSNGNNAAAFELHDKFLSAFVAALSPEARALLTTDAS
jgi:EpsI family protein